MDLGCTNCTMCRRLQNPQSTPIRQAPTCAKTAAQQSLPMARTCQLNDPVDNATALTVTYWSCSSATSLLIPRWVRQWQPGVTWTVLTYFAFCADSKQEVDSSKLVPGVDSGAAASTSAALKQHAMPASQMRSVLAAAAMRRIQSQGRGQTKPTAAASEVQVVEAGPQALSLSRRHSVEVIDLIDSQS